MDRDAELMRLVAGGDRAAFRAIVEKYQTPLYNFFLRTTGSVEDAEDLAQDLFLNVFRAAGRYDPRSPLKTYLYRIASNLAVSHARKRSYRRAASIEEMVESGIEPASRRMEDDPASSAEAREIERRYREALLALPSDWRVALELRIGRELSYGEIAEAMGKSVSAVESILVRARERIADSLGRGRGEGGP